MRLSRALKRGSPWLWPASVWVLGALSGCGSSGSVGPAGMRSTDGADGGDGTTSPVTGDGASNLGDGSMFVGDAGDGAPTDDASPSDSSIADASAMVDASPADSTVPAADGGVPCKRGLATNMAPSAAFTPTASSPGLTWWYDWSNQPSSASSVEFVPMIWGSSSLGAAIPAGSRFLLTFNEPNFKAQSDLTSQQAASAWPTIETTANAAPIVSPGVNFCGSASDTSQCTDPAVTDPYSYLKDFLTDCPGCEVDYVAVHWYNCDLPSLQAYLEGNVTTGGTLQGFVQFGKPIWLTEFSCDTSHSVADQKAYMQAAIPYLESNPNVFRYSWFNATPIPNAELMNTDGSLTDLGQTYVSLPETCRP